MAELGLENGLLRAAAAGEPDAVSHLGALARAIARSYLRSRLWSREDVEDVAEEAVVACMTHVGDLRSADSFAAWVRTTARRAAIALVSDHITLPLDSLLDAPTPAPDTSSPASDSIGPALARLRDARRHLLALRYEHDLSYSEIASHLQTSIPIVRRRLQGARGQLKREVMKEMVSDAREAVRLTPDDVARLRAAAALADPSSEDARLRTVHVSGRHVYGGTLHRGAVCTLEVPTPLPDVRIDAAPLVDLPDMAGTDVAFMGCDDDEVRIALPDGRVIVAPTIECESVLPGALSLAEAPLPYSIAMEHAHLAEMTDHVASVSWGRDRRDPTIPIAELRIEGDGEDAKLCATVVRADATTVMLAVHVPATLDPLTEPIPAGVSIRVNRGYLRECLQALSPRLSRVCLDFGGPLEMLRLWSPEISGLWVALMPVAPPPEEQEE